MEEIALCAEIMAESRRNPAVARIYQDWEADVREQFHGFAAQCGGTGRSPPRHRSRRHRDGSVRAGGRAVVAARGGAIVQCRRRDADRARHGRTDADEPSAGIASRVRENCHESGSLRRRWPRRRGERLDCVRSPVSARDGREQGRGPHRGERREGVPRRRRAGAGRAAQPQARSLRPHRGGPQDDGDGARLRRRVRAEGAARPARERGRRDRHPVRRSARVAGRAGARHADRSARPSSRRR